MLKSYFYILKQKKIVDIKLNLNEKIFFKEKSFLFLREKLSLMYVIYLFFYKCKVRIKYFPEMFCEAVINRDYRNSILKKLKKIRINM